MKTPAKIAGVWYIHKPPEEIPKHMHYLIEDYKAGMNRKVYPIELISLFHQRFEEIPNG